MVEYRNSSLSANRQVNCRRAEANASVSETAWLLIRKMNSETFPTVPIVLRSKARRASRTERAGQVTRVSGYRPSGQILMRAGEIEGLCSVCRACNLAAGWLANENNGSPDSF